VGTPIDAHAEKLISTIFDDYIKVCLYFQYYRTSLDVRISSEPSDTTTEITLFDRFKYLLDIKEIAGHPVSITNDSKYISFELYRVSGKKFAFNKIPTNTG